MIIDPNIPKQAQSKLQCYLEHYGLEHEATKSKPHILDQKRSKSDNLVRIAKQAERLVKISAKDPHTHRAWSVACVRS